MGNLYWKVPADLPRWLKASDFPEPHVEVWDENWQAIVTFKKFSNQWRYGNKGPFALDYNVVFAEVARLKLADDDRDKLMDQIRIIEDAALTELHKA